MGVENGVRCGQVDGKYQGYRNPLTTTVKQPYNLIAESFVEACQELGFPEVDLNSPGHEVGCSLFQHTIRDGVRCSTVSPLSMHVGHEVLRATLLCV